MLVAPNPEKLKFDAARRRNALLVPVSFGHRIRGVSMRKMRATRVEVDPVEQRSSHIVVVGTAVVGGEADVFAKVECCHLRKADTLAGIGEDANYEFSISLLPITPVTAEVRKRARDRAEALRLAGGPKPPIRDRAVALAREGAWCERVISPTSVFPAAIWLACATKVCSSRRVTASIAPLDVRRLDPTLQVAAQSPIGAAC